MTFQLLSVLTQRFLVMWHFNCFHCLCRQVTFQLLSVLKLKTEISNVFSATFSSVTPPPFNADTSTDTSTPFSASPLTDTDFFSSDIQFFPDILKPPFSFFKAGKHSTLPSKVCVIVGQWLLLREGGAAGGSPSLLPLLSQSRPLPAAFSVT